MEFGEMLGRETMRGVTDRELELIFEIFDVTKDGRLGREEVLGIAHREARGNGLSSGKIKK